jgi:hypothetical protein
MSVYVYSTPEDAEPKIGQWSVRIDWCEKYCSGRWQYKGKGTILFNDEKDYLAFLLRWT